MEDYLRYLTTLRSQMNDVEDQATKISVEEQKLTTTLKTMEEDLSSAKNETKKLKEDVDHLMEAKGQLCSQILEKQRKIISLGYDSSTFCQSLELMEQERDSLSAKLATKSSYYAEVAEDIQTKLRQREAWFNSNRVGAVMAEQRLNDKETKTLETLDSAKSELERIKQKRSDLAVEIKKMNQSLEHLRCKASDFEPELFSMDIKTLEEERDAVLLDKTRETEYLQSLQSQFDKLKGISHVIRCVCGKEYQVCVDGPVRNDANDTS